MSKMSKSMRQLVVDYGAKVSRAMTLAEVDWTLLAQRLCVDSNLIAEAVEAEGDTGKAALWLDILNARIESASNESVFRQHGWQAVEGGALRTLQYLLDKKAVKDPTELLAIAKVAQGINTGGGGNPKQPAPASVSVNINGFGGQQEVAQVDEDGNPILPGAGEKIAIDLSPRVAQTLGKKAERREERIIDAERLEAEELRTMNLSGEIEQESESEFGNEF